MRSSGYFRVQSCKFGVIRVMFGILKVLLCFRALSEIFSIFSKTVSRGCL